MADNLADVLTTGLRQALSEGGPVRLYRAGKLSGLFTSRAGTPGDAAAQALRNGLLEPVRTEVKGKTTIEWVRITPDGVEYLAAHDSPSRPLTELRELLATCRNGTPPWLADARKQMADLSDRFEVQARQWQDRLDALTKRVEEALAKIERATLELPDGSDVLPWAREALGYLDRRRRSGGTGPCPLPELFSVLSAVEPDLSVTSYHDGLRLLRRRGWVRLFPAGEAAEPLPEPEYALVDGDGSDVFYFVDR